MRLIESIQGWKLFYKTSSKTSLIKCHFSRELKSQKTEQADI